MISRFPFLLIDCQLPSRLPYPYINLNITYKVLSLTISGLICCDMVQTLWWTFNVRSPLARTKGRSSLEASPWQTVVSLSVPHRGLSLLHCIGQRRFLLVVLYLVGLGKGLYCRVILMEGFDSSSRIEGFFLW